jgi:endonuclease/exonuclease/phosphatase (EEP) superfamily protein YafD
LTNIVPKFALLSRSKWLLATVASLWLAGCIHIPLQPTLGHSAAYQTKQLPADCETDMARPSITEVAEGGLSPARITLLTWNIFKQSRSNWLTDFQQLSHNTDLLILQEAYMDESLGSVLSDSPYHWLMTTTFYYQDNATGVLTASRNPSTRYCALYTKEPLVQTPKSILLSTYPLAGTDQNLLVANVHGINFSLGLESYRDQFKALGKVLRNHSGPLILAGDFNSWREDRQAILNELSKELSLQQVEYESHHRITVFGNPIDHVYYRGLELVHASSPHVSSSDHNPLLVTFTMTGAGQERYAKNP